MINFLIRYPSKLTSRILLITGLIIFIPIYSYMLKLFSDMEINSQSFQNILISFDGNRFRDFCTQLDQQAHLQTFIYSYKLNILSVTGFMLAFCSVLLIIARNITTSSRLYKLAFVFPIIVLLITILDISSSAALLFASADLQNISDGNVFFFDASYIVRTILLYIIFIWIIGAIFYFIIRKIRKKK